MDPSASRSTDVAADGARGSAAASTRRVMVAAIATQVSAVIPVLLLGALAVFIRDDIPMSDAELGLVVSSFFMASSASAFPGGRLADRIGPGGAMSWAMVASVLSMVGLAAFADSRWHLIAAMVLGGLGSGFGVAASNLALSRLVPVAKQGIAFGLKQASIPAGSILAGLSVPALGLSVGWRWAFVIAPLLAAGAFLMSWRGGGLADRTQASVSRHTAPLRPLLLLAAASGFAGASATATLGFYVASGDARGFDTGTVGLLLAAGSACGIVARIGWGWLADRRDRGHIAFLAWLFGAGSVGFGLLGVVETVPLLALATAVVFAAGWSWSGLLFMIVTRGSPGAPATATGIMSAGGGLGGLLGPLVFGAIAEGAGYTWAWMVTGSWMLVAAACAWASLWVWRRHQTHGTRSEGAGSRGSAAGGGSAEFDLHRAGEDRR